MAKEIGREILKCLEWKTVQEGEEESKVESKTEEEIEEVKMEEC